MKIFVWPKMWYRNKFKGLTYILLIFIIILLFSSHCYLSSLVIMANRTLKLNNLYWPAVAANLLPPQDRQKCTHPPLYHIWMTRLSVCAKNNNPPPSCPPIRFFFYIFGKSALFIASTQLATPAKIDAFSEPQSRLFINFNCVLILFFRYNTVIGWVNWE